MKNPEWLIPLKTARSRLARIDNRDLKKEARGLVSRHKIKIQSRNPKSLYRQKYHSEVVVNGQVLKVVTKLQLATFLGIRYATVHSWYKQGVFGEPVFTDINPQGSERQYWLVRQMIAFIIVLNQILKEGYLSIPWTKLTDQVESIHNGMEHYANLTFNRLDKDIPIDDNKTRFGVEFLEQETP